MEFQKLTLDCIETLKPFFEENNCRICDFTLGGTFLWRDYHKTQYAIADDLLYLKVAYPEPALAPPRGKAGAAVGRRAYERIIDASAPAVICAVTKPVLDDILEMFPRSAVRTDRAWSDYLYLSDDIVNLAGRKFSGQRNHINRFKRENPVWSFAPITANNLTEARDFIEKYSREHLKDSAAYSEGNKKTLEALCNLDLYGAFGGMLYVNGAAVGVTLGETVGDTLYIHAEKADTDYHGAYPMLMNQFAKMFAHDGIKYINREEDDGVEGLRISKLSYHPTALLDKYIVEIQT